MESHEERLHKMITCALLITGTLLLSSKGIRIQHSALYCTLNSSCGLET